VADEPDFQITKEGVMRLISDLKPGKSAGPDRITKRILCLDLELVSDILSCIFNLSIKSATLPEEWKLANVTPVFKQGKRTLVSNYRPISLTSICCKLLEHIVLHQLSVYLDDILYLNQHGFRSKLSCTTQLLTVFHDLAADADKGIESHAIALDFSKAFDLVPHSLLIQKLIKYNISSVLVHWITDFLTNRYQCVVINGVASDLVPVTSGVPQGSVLGPALFLLYINDIVDVIQHCTIKLYADDTLLYKPITTTHDCELLQEDLRAVHTWSQENQMKFNTAKSYVVFFSLTRNHQFNFSYSIMDTPIQTSTSIKYLGIHMQENLHWDKHISHILIKANKVLGLLRSTLFDAPTDLKKLAYSSLCRPLLEYASEVWDPSNKQQIHSLEVLQNKALRFIYNIRGRDVSITEIRQQHHIVTLEQRRRDKRISTLISIIENEDLHPSLSNTLSSMLPKSSMSTRNDS
jgi:hypothetical protein